MTTSILITTEIGDFSGEILDAGFRKDEAFVIVATIAFVRTTAPATGSMRMVTREVGLSVLVVVVSRRLDLAGWVACIVRMMSSGPSVVIAMGGVFGRGNES